eukprot:TRINITY_DN6960_c0_g1_i2.p1 TRINITY_DN6960_c0_g1~~TRINITY_DN6960_c0_g1_i2.p1  ORF type:complete len:163 (+),score=14.99 TRINITY_DN6960_c0_g1_i2:538-1026(+)
MQYVSVVASSYQIYDLVIMCFQQTDPVEMWIHHFLGAAGLMTLLHNHECSFYAISFMFTEGTVLFVNSLWYMRSLKVDSKWIQLFRILRAISYLIFRVWLAPWAAYRAFTHNDLPQLSSIHPVTRYQVIVWVPLMTLLNFYWTFEAFRFLLPRKVKVVKKVE